MLDRTTALQTYQTFIDGRWTDAVSGKTFQTSDPYTGAPWALIPECDKADVDRAVDAAHRAFESGAWPKMTPTARGKIMRRIAELIEQHAEYLGEVEVRDNGKLISEMVAQTKYMPQWFYYYAGLADKIHGSVVSVDRPDHFTYILREPVGVCAFITPWNSPLMLATWKLAPALAAGCTVVIKPSEFTSASLLEFMKLVIAESGLPPGVVNVVTGYGPVVGEPLVTHPKVAKVAFTGGSATGARVNELAAKTFKKVSLELGGKSPNIVFNDASPAAVEGAANAIFFNHGQCCVAGSRLYVQEGRFDEVVEGVAEIAKSIKLGPGMDASTQMGPLVSDEQLSRVTGYLESGKADGATALSGGVRWGDSGYFVEPTVLTNVRPDMKVVREEIFGPVVVAAPFQSLDDIAAAANDSDYGLGAGIWTKDISKAHALAKKIRAGSVYVNCYNVFDAALPFGGYKQSGWGREMGEAVFHNYTETKAVTTAL